MKIICNKFEFADLVAKCNSNTCYGCALCGICDTSIGCNSLIDMVHIIQDEREVQDTVVSVDEVAPEQLKLAQ